MAGEDISAEWVFKDDVEGRERISEAEDDIEDDMGDKDDEDHDRHLLLGTLIVYQIQLASIPVIALDLLQELAWVAELLNGHPE
ncbi:hypothetical protein PISMIDRAFT_15468 [Pisolithus microcarpus 441]|uniref:Uncharacterized protein n=1 Tax=Pisolithus microcarpus 441 TaxID=765257 RepID=A0A0C9Z3K9_9AGAM|nr:hypothetical protein PISMIDRAFT_15468 [Pisolithus microcarpus 441]